MIPFFSSISNGLNWFDFCVQVSFCNFLTYIRNNPCKFPNFKIKFWLTTQTGVIASNLVMSTAVLLTEWSERCKIPIRLANTFLEEESKLWQEILNLMIYWLELSNKSSNWVFLVRVWIPLPRKYFYNFIQTNAQQRKTFEWQWSFL